MSTTKKVEIKRAQLQGPVEAALTAAALQLGLPTDGDHDARLLRVLGLVVSKIALRNKWALLSVVSVIAECYAKEAKADADAKAGITGPGGDA